MADYKILSASVGEDARNSSGTVEPAGSDKLTWGLSGDHYFFALYPAATMSGVTASEAVLEKHATEDHKATVRGRIPAVQDVTWDASKQEYKPNMRYAYMYAAAKVTPSQAASVSLPFKPLITAFEFTLKSNPDFPVGSNLTKVELTAATNLSGSFTATLDKDGLSEISSVSGAGTTLTLNLGTGVALSTSNAVKFTFLALPLKQEHLTLKLTFANGLTRSLELRNGSAFIDVEACRKLYISNITPPGRKMSVDNISLNHNRDYKVFIPAVGWRGFNSGIVSYRYEGGAASSFGRGYNMYYWTASPTDTRQNNYPETPNRIQAASFHAAEDLFHPRSRDCRTDGFPILCAHD